MNILLHGNVQGRIQGKLVYKFHHLHLLHVSVSVTLISLSCSILNHFFKISSEHAHAPPSGNPVFSGRMFETLTNDHHTPPVNPSSDPVFPTWAKRNTKQCDCIC